MTPRKLPVYAVEALQAIAWRLAPRSRFAIWSSRLYLKTFMRFWPWQQLIRPPENNKLQ